VRTEKGVLILALDGQHDNWEVNGRMLRSWTWASGAGWDSKVRNKAEATAGQESVKFTSAEPLVLPLIMDGNRGKAAQGNPS
jgi:hypothetical protein